jgi:hypothetical protein
MQRVSPGERQLPLKTLTDEKDAPGGRLEFSAPCCLCPKAAMKRLALEQLQAIVAYELCHVRRRDNLTGFIHMPVETVYLVSSSGVGPHPDSEQAAGGAASATPPEPPGPIDL